MTYTKEQLEAVFKVYTEDDYTNQAQDILLEFFRQGFIHGQENIKDIYHSHLEWFAEYLKGRDVRLVEASQQAVAQARLDALMEAAKQVCIPCRQGKFKVRVWRGFYRHINDQGHVFQDCDADRIWLLINGANESEGRGE